MRSWRYQYVSDTSDRTVLDDRADDPDGDIRLLRRAAGSDVEEVLERDGVWRASHVLLDIRAKGSLEKVTEISPDRARDTIRRWYDIGRIADLPPFEQTVPAQLSTGLDLQTAVRERADLLRRATLSDGQIFRAREVLLDGPGDLAPAWVSSAGTTVVPAEFPLLMLETQDATRVVEAFAGQRLETAWVVTTSATRDPGERDRPGGVALRTDPVSFVAASQIFGVDGVLATDPDLRCVILQTAHYALVGGPVEFVETALGTRVDTAADRFREHAAQEDDVALGGSGGQLRAVVARYLPQR